MKTAAVSKQKALKIPAFLYRGFEIPGLVIPESLYADFGKPAYKSAPKSIPLSYKAGLYTVGRDISLGIEDTDSLPEPVKEAGRLVYSECQKRPSKGHWHKDAVMIEPGATIKGSIRPGKDYVVGIYFQDIDGFEKKGDKWDIIASPQTREEKIWLPKGDGNFIVPTRYGLYNRLGLPEETTENRDEAVKRLVDAGFTEEQARKELSRCYRRNSGLAAVDSWSYDYDGPLCVALNLEPDDRDSNIGSFPASKLAERSEAPKNSRFRLVTKEDYNSLLSDRELLEELRNKLKK